MVISRRKLASKKLKLVASLTMGQESAYLIVFLKFAISELKKTLRTFLDSFSFSGFGSRLMHTTVTRSTTTTKKKARYATDNVKAQTDRCHL